MLLTALTLGKCFVEAVDHWHKRRLVERAKDKLRASIVRGSLVDVRESLRHNRTLVNLMLRVGEKQHILFYNLM